MCRSARSLLSLGPSLPTISQLGAIATPRPASSSRPSPRPAEAPKSSTKTRPTSTAVASRAPKVQARVQASRAAGCQGGRPSPLSASVHPRTPLCPGEPSGRRMASDCGHLPRNQQGKLRYFICALVVIHHTALPSWQRLEEACLDDHLGAHAQVCNDEYRLPVVVSPGGAARLQSANMIAPMRTQSLLLRLLYRA